jgi:hypothetical protein
MPLFGTSQHFFASSNNYGEDNGFYKSATIGKPQAREGLRFFCG